MHEQLPNLTRYDYFYDQQIRRFLLQVVRAFSGFQYMTGPRGNIPAQLKLVPCTMAKRNRQVAFIQRNGSENVINTCPMITIDLAGFTFDEQRLQNPGHVGHVQVFERAKDAQGNYTGEIGNAITVERLMPRPFTLQVQVDIWTSNLDQKCQLLEQILQIIYPTFDIQNSDNPLDWSALTVCHPKDMTWTSVSVPVGADEQIDIATIQMEIPMWLSPPAKIKRQKIIEQIITNINEGTYDDNGELQHGAQLAREITTPGNHWLRLSTGTGGAFAQLLGPNSNEFNPDGEHYDWPKLFEQYGKMVTEDHQLRIRFSTDDGASEIIGALSTVPGQPHKLEWQIDVDSLPSNTLAAVSGVIDPDRTGPGQGLPNAATGQRYLLVNDLPKSNMTWNSGEPDGFGARIGSIIERKPTKWEVVFDPMANEGDLHFVLNTSTGKQLRWTGSEWGMAIDGDYAPGYWRFI